MSVKKEVLLGSLSKSFPGAKIEVIALVDDNDHYKVVIKSNVFSGISKIAQHRMVNKAIKDNNLDIHALSIETMKE